MDHLFYLCLVLVMFSRPFIAAFWSTAGKRLTSWLLFVICNFPMWSGVVLDCIDS